MRLNGNTNDFRVSVGRVVARGSLDSCGELMGGGYEVVFDSYSYEDTVEPLIEYIGGLVDGLSGVDKIYLEGSVISPELSRGNRYVSLLFCLRTTHGGSTYISPLGMGDLVFSIDNNAMKSVSAILTRSSIYPFLVVRLFKMLFDGVKTHDLLRRVYRSAGDLLDATLSRLKVPKKCSIDPSEYSGGVARYIVVYRCQRSYVSSVIEPSDLARVFREPIKGLILDHHVASLYTSNRDAAYYYAAILNLMVYLTIKHRIGRLARDQFGRPLLAIKKSGLEWRDLEWQREVARISEEIHRKRGELLEILGLRSDLEIFELVDRCEDNEIIEILRRGRVSNIFKHISYSMEKISEIVLRNTSIENIIEAIKRYTIEKPYRIYKG
ncbi:hypothetical protein ATG_06120 [Desulfurococcaceae archaeon AG1]|nr:hypothetical protein ATG_06120 [Desulfurococcaceae archaeon AG1]